MSQITKGIRSILSAPAIYRLFGQLIGGSSGRRILVNEYVRPKRGDRILDIGCGPGDIVPHLPDSIKYLGFDTSQEYIEYAQNHFGDRATFICQHVSDKNLEQDSYFDIALAVGILHHLDDLDALNLFRLAKTALKPGGRLITFDGVYTENQSFCAKYIISSDRGQNVRTKDGYLAVATQVFHKSTLVSDTICSEFHILTSFWNAPTKASL